MGLNLGANILTSGFLVTVVIFLALMGIFFVSAESKIGEVLTAGDSRTNDQGLLKKAFDYMRIAYTLAFISAGVALLLAILYAGHETVIKPSEYWHMALYFITVVLWLISLIYAYLALDKVYDVRVATRNGADAYIWAGMLMAIFAFVGITATANRRLGINIMRKQAVERVTDVENKVNEHLPAIRNKVDTHLDAIRNKVETDLGTVKTKVGDLHEAAGLSGGVTSPMLAGSNVGSVQRSQNMQLPQAQIVSQMNQIPKVPRAPLSVAVNQMSPQFPMSSLASGTI
jgi:hypothetical protein